MNEIKDLQQLMENKGYSQAHVAKAIGKSPAVINQVLQGKYNGDVKAINEAIRSFIQKESERDKSRKISTEFVATNMARRAMELIDFAHVECEISVLYGAAGLGKTMVMREYSKRHPNAILIEADPCYGAGVLLEELCKRLGINKRGNIHELSEECVTALKGSGRLIMVDEAELLHYRALEVLRRIHDKAGVGVVLAGMPRLIINLKGKKGEYAQLYSRVGIALDMGSNLSRTDFDELAVSLLPEAEEASIADALFDNAKGNARRLVKLARGTIRTCTINKAAINANAVKRFASMLIQ